MQYERAVTNAFGEVSSALVAHQKLAQAEKEQARAVAAYRQAVTLSNQRYVVGLRGYLDVLQAEQQSLPRRERARADPLQPAGELRPALQGAGRRLESLGSGLGSSRRDLGDEGGLPAVGAG